MSSTNNYPQLVFLKKTRNTACIAGGCLDIPCLGVPFQCNGRMRARRHVGVGKSTSACIYFLKNKNSAQSTHTHCLDFTLCFTLVFGRMVCAHDVCMYAHVRVRVRVRVHNALLCLPRLSGKQDDTVPIAAMPYLSLQLHVNSTIIQ